MNKNTEAMKQYLADRTARSGAELRELTGTDTVLLPVTGEDKLYVAVGTLAGIAQVAGKSFDEAAGNTNKAVLKDEQIISIGLEMPAYAQPGSLIDYARAIEAAVLANASKAVVVEPVAWMRNDGKECRTDEEKKHMQSLDFGHWKEIAACFDVPLYAAPAPADNPSTAGGAQIGIHDQTFHELAMDYRAAPPFLAHAAYTAMIAHIDARLAAPALNPSDVPSPWISVDERLPDDDCRVLAATWFTAIHEQHMDIVAFRRGTRKFSHSDVTHWMPLPPTPVRIKGAAAQSVEGGDHV